jgi:RNA polymerase sigma factor (sigma-70 family)
VTDDSTLLSRYAAQGDEAAFAEVVRRHLPFVYSAALRRLGRDPHHAQDVTQVVFCALARDAARIARQPVLGGWLYTATRNAVINVVRGEKRRRTREEQACLMQHIDSQSDTATDWSKLRSVLDAAMDRLSARDREAILLRFFQGQSFGEIGATAGVGEDAARKRIDRALAKLRDALRPHGVASTSAALAALLATQPASAAPAGLLASVTGAALSTGSVAALELATTLTMTKLQAGIVAAVVCASAIGLIMQQRVISTLRAEAALAQRSAANGSATLGKRGGPAGASMANSGNSGPGGASAMQPSATAPGELLAETSAALGHGKVPERYFAFVSVLQKLSRENWREVLQAFDEERKRTGLIHPEVFNIFARRVGEIAGDDAVMHFLKRGWRGDADEAMMGWASKHPVEALQWMGRDADADTRHRVMGAAIRGLALTEPDLAIKTLEEQPIGERPKHADGIITAMLRSAGLDGVERLVGGMIARGRRRKSEGRLSSPGLRRLLGQTDRPVRRRHRG